MPSPIQTLTRAASRRSDEPLNILSYPTHERYQSGLARTGHRFYLWQGEHIKTWNSNYGPLPDNHVLLNPDLKNNQIPDDIDIDIVLSQNKAGQFQQAIQIARYLHCPLISVEHTLPVPQWPQSYIRQLKTLSGDINVFISEYNRRMWGFGENEGYVVHHGVDTELFCPDNTERKPHILSVVNDWINRDWCQPAGQKLLSEIGYIDIEKVYPGLRLLTDSGRFHSILETFERDYFGPMVSVWIDGIPASVKFTSEHDLRVFRNGQWKYLPATSMRVGDRLRFPELLQTDWSCNDTEFAWLIGLIVADGSIGKNGNIEICLHTSEKKLARRAKLALEEVCETVTIKYAKRGKSRCIRISSTNKVLAAWLYDRIGGKSYSKALPEFIMNGANSIKLAALKGLWNGDGSFKNGKRTAQRACYSTISVRLASQVSALMHNFGIKCTISKHKRTTNKSNGKIVPIFRVTCTAKDAIENCKNLINNGNIGKPYSYQITKIEIDNEWVGKVYNCKVATDPSYVVYPGFVAHNCCGFKIWERTTKGLPTHPVGDTPGLSKPAASIPALVAEYQQAQVFINTSTVSPVPTSLLEAMSCGCAVVSTANCMIPEIIEHGQNGFITNDEKEMRDFCQQLLRDKKLAQQLGACARETIKKRFSMTEFVKGWNSVFRLATSFVYTGE